MTMMPKKWSHLPNARHIDRILADVIINSESWAAVWNEAVSDATWNADWSAALNAAKDAATEAATEAARSVAWNATLHVAKYVDWGVARNMARSSILALIAWDESSEYLNLSSEQVQVLSLLGDKKAVLMFPAVMVFEKSKELA